MRILITGAAGFIGHQLTATLLARGSLCDGMGEARPISEIVLVDMVPIEGADDDRIRAEIGDFRDRDFLCQLTDAEFDSVFHLAATLTIDAEKDFDRGLAVNVHGLMQLLDACRAQARAPRFVFASSIAAFGGPLPGTVDDTVAQTPQTSYGTHKAIAELLINDYSRHGFIDGRALRLPIVLIRPGTPSPVVSDRIAAIVREPLLGRDVICPLAAETSIPVASARRVATALAQMHDLPAEALGHTRAMNLPSLTVTVGEMVETLQKIDKCHKLGHINWEPDADLQAVVDGWPSNFISERASRAGICADAHFGEIVDAFVDEFLPLASV